MSLFLLIVYERWRKTFYKSCSGKGGCFGAVKSESEERRVARIIGAWDDFTD